MDTLRGLARKVKNLARTTSGPQQNSGPYELMLRPFETGDLTPVPDGWNVGPPDFVGVASGKAGTSWWYQLLLEHPAVKSNRVDRKELCYFYHFGYEGMDPDAIDTYRQAFAAPPGAICGEWSPAYLNFPFALDHLAEAAPDTKLLAIVRNPVDRILSARNMQISQRLEYMGLEGAPAYLYKTYSLSQQVVLQSMLSLPFRRLLSKFDRSQLLLLQYEQCKRDPRAAIARTYRFLGLDDTFVPDSLERKVNESEYILPDFESEERAQVAEYFIHDVISFAELFPEDIDLSLWPDFVGQ